MVGENGKGGLSKANATIDADSDFSFIVQGVYEARFRDRNSGSVRDKENEVLRAHSLKEKFYVRSRTAITKFYATEFPNGLVGHRFCRVGTKDHAMAMVCGERDNFFYDPDEGVYKYESATEMLKDITEYLNKIGGSGKKIEVACVQAV